MTAEYFCSRSLGNIISQIFMTLSQRGKSDEVHQCVDTFRNVANSHIDGSPKLAEEQFLENVYSKYVLVHTDIPQDLKTQFISTIAKYYLHQEKLEEEAERTCIEGMSMPNVSKEQMCKFLLRLANVYLKQNKEEQAQQKLYEALCTAQIEGEEAYHLFKALGEHYQGQDRYAKMEEKVDRILTSQDISEQNKVTAVR